MTSRGVEHNCPPESAVKRELRDEVTLALKDGKTFKASRKELSAASDFFSALLKSDMKENRDGVVRLNHITEAVMSEVLTFIRSGRVVITQKNAKNLIVAADYLLIQDLKALAERLLERELSPSNCILMYYFAEQYHCEILTVSSGKFIVSNFTTVAESHDFLDLESQQVERWICLDDINVTSEGDVFKIILKWIYQSKWLKRNRKEKFEELFRHMRLALVPRTTLLSDIAQHKLVKKNSKCLKLVMDAINGIYHTMDCPQSPRSWRDHLVVQTGSVISCYRPDKDEWYELTEGSFDGAVQEPFQMMSFQGKLYFFQRKSEVDIFDPPLNCWSKLRCDATNENTVSVPLNTVTVVWGEMYSIHIKSARDCSTRLYVSKYDSTSNHWNEIVPCRFGLKYGACPVAMNHYLYVVGGVCRDDVSAKVARLHTIKNRWERMSDLKIARYDACGVAANGKIFIVGGVDKHGTCSKACEVCNVETNEWYLMANLIAPRSNASMICLNETLYIVGGVDYFGAAARSIESYDLENKEWEEMTEIPIYSARQVSGSTVFRACTHRLNHTTVLKAVR